MDSTQYNNVGRLLQVHSQDQGGVQGFFKTGLLGMFLLDWSFLAIFVYLFLQKSRFFSEFRVVQTWDYFLLWDKPYSNNTTAPNIDNSD